MKKNKNICAYCSIPSVKYKCLMCDCAGKIEVPDKIEWHSSKPGDFTVKTTKFIVCDQCNGKGWILVAPIIAHKYPHNVI